MGTTLEDVLTCHDCRRGIPLEGWDPDPTRVDADVRGYLRGLIPSVYGDVVAPCLVCRGCHEREEKKEEWEDPPRMFDEPLSDDAMLILCTLKGVKLPPEYKWTTPMAITRSDGAGTISHGPMGTGTRHGATTSPYTLGIRPRRYPRTSASTLVGSGSQPSSGMPRRQSWQVRTSSRVVPISLDLPYHDPA
eukprot:jgi/Mesvir1/9039/Mv21322-RA.1